MIVREKVMSDWEAELGMMFWGMMLTWATGAAEGRFGQYGWEDAFDRRDSFELYTFGV